MEIVSEASSDALICSMDILYIMGRQLRRRKHIAEGIELYYRNKSFDTILARKSRSPLRALLQFLPGSMGKIPEPKWETEPPSWQDLDAYAYFHDLMIEDAEMACKRLDYLKSSFKPLAGHQNFRRATEATEFLHQFLIDLQPEDILTERFESAVNDVKSSLEHVVWTLGDYLSATTFTLHGIDNFVSLSLVDDNPQAMIQHAFTHFEDRLRNRVRADPDLFGWDLINAAFGKRGRLAYGKTEAERERTRDFLAGAYGLFRNPRNHRLLDDDTGTALSILVVVNLMLKIVNEATER